MMEKKIVTTTLHFGQPAETEKTNTILLYLSLPQPRLCQFGHKIHEFLCNVVLAPPHPCGLAI